MSGHPIIDGRKSAHDMTVPELQAEIARLQAILHHKVCGDPREGVVIKAAGIALP